eukprot:7021086-Alexandrium_andersonii.AAC.1
MRRARAGIASVGGPWRRRRGLDRSGQVAAGCTDGCRQRGGGGAPSPATAGDTTCANAAAVATL